MSGRVTCLHVCVQRCVHVWCVGLVCLYVLVGGESVSS